MVSVMSSVHSCCVNRLQFLHQAHYLCSLSVLSAVPEARVVFSFVHSLDLFLPFECLSQTSMCMSFSGGTLMGFDTYPREIVLPA